MIRDITMTARPGFYALLGEWRTILMSLHYTRDHLTAAVKNRDEEGDEHLVYYDHLERLDSLIPRIEHALHTYQQQVETSVDDPLFRPIP